MAASSVMFLAVVVLCIGSLVPSAIRRRLHASSARLADRTSGAVRVVARSADPGAPAALPAARPAPVALPAGRSSRPVLAGRAPAASTPAATPAATPAPETASWTRPRPSARVLRRRRGLAATALAATVLGWVLVAVGVLPAWSGALPTAGLLIVLAVLRRHAATVPVRTAPAVAVDLGPVRGADGPDAGTGGVPAPRTAPAGDGWVPVPVPLPTYLLKPPAPRWTAPAPVLAPAASAAPEVVDLREPVAARAVGG